MDETFTFRPLWANNISETRSFDGGAGDDTLVVTFDVRPSLANPLLQTNFIDNGDGTFSATYFRTTQGETDSVSVTNIENIFITVVTNGPFGASVRTGGGDDRIITDFRADTIDAGNGEDTVDGGTGNATGLAEADIISKDFSDFSVDIDWNIQTGEFSGPGSFVNLEAFGVLQTGSGNDSIITSDFFNNSALPGDETISTGAGNDTVTVSNGIDDVDLGAGSDDRLIVNYANAAFPSHINSILIQNPDGSYRGEHRGEADGGTRTGVTFDGVEHFTLIYPDADADDVKTGDGDDFVSTGAWADRIDVGRGLDTVDGGEGGNDLDGLAKEFGTSAPAIAFDLSQNTFSGPGSYTNLEYFIDLRTGSSDDVIVTANLFDAGVLDNDVINTRGGDDTVTVFIGRDTVDTGSGNDTLIVDYASSSNFVGSISTVISRNADGSASGSFIGSADSGTRVGVDFANVEMFFITGTSNRDAIETGDGNDTVSGGAGADTLDGGAGIDTLDYTGSTAAVNIDLSANTASGGDAQGDVIANFEAALGGGGSDTLTGTSSSNFIDGGNQDDMLVGAGGNDTLIGSAGRDTLDGGTGADFLSGRVRDDSLMGGGGTDTLAGNNGADTLEGGSGGDLVFGGPVGDNIFGDGGSDILRGNAGDDTIEGGTGDDDILGSADSDVILGNAGDDTMGGNGDDDEAFGGTGEDLVRGNAGNDIVRGEAGNDQLLGGNGDDTVIGGVGEDRLAGGTGADRFVFAEGDTGSNIANADLITDFDQSEGDRIRLNAIDAITGGGDDAFDFIGTGAFSGTAGELRYEQSGGRTNVFGDTDGDGTADFAVQLLGTVDLVAGDFVL